MSYLYDIHDYVKVIDQKGIHYGEIGYITDRFPLPDPHPCNMYTIIVINASASELTLPEEYLSEITTDLKDLEDVLNGQHTSKICECGIDKLGHGRHSNWCPKYRI